MISFLVPGAVAYEQAKSILSSNKVVHVVTVRELKPLNALEPKPINNPVHIGSNSTHAFFYDSNDTNNTVAIPLSGIVCIAETTDTTIACQPNGENVWTGGPTIIRVVLEGAELGEQIADRIIDRTVKLVCTDDKENGCRLTPTAVQIITQIWDALMNATTDEQRKARLQPILDELQKLSLKPEYNPWITTVIEALEENVTEHGVRQHIAQQMSCDKDQRLEVSEFIRFGRNKATLDSTEEQKVSTFVQDVRKREERPDWWVFGFASPDGESGVNKELSEDRAKVAAEALCAALDAAALEAGEQKRECKDRNVIVRHLDENHPINGIANSRSARVAVCAKQEAS